MVLAFALPILLPCLVAPASETPTLLRFAYREGEIRYQKTTWELSVAAGREKAKTIKTSYGRLVIRKTSGTDAAIENTILKTLRDGQVEVLPPDVPKHFAYWVGPDGLSKEVIRGYPEVSGLTDLVGKKGATLFGGLVYPGRAVTKGEIWMIQQPIESKGFAAKEQTITYKLLDSVKGSRARIRYAAPSISSLGFDLGPLDAAKSKCNMVVTFDVNTMEFLGEEGAVEVEVESQGQKLKILIKVKTTQSDKPFDGVN